MKHSTIPAVADHLLRARARIVRNGWRTNGLGSAWGPVCAIGALTLEGGDWDAAHDLLRDALPYPTGIINYNDTPGRTKKEILALFDRAIELALRAA